jgi:hypothetical protein
MKLEIGKKAQRRTYVKWPFVSRSEPRSRPLHQKVDNWLDSTNQSRGYIKTSGCVVISMITPLDVNPSADANPEARHKPGTCAKADRKHTALLSADIVCLVQVGPSQQSEQARG